MKGYLMQEKSFIRGESIFIESGSPANSFAVAFEDDGDTGYFYAIDKLAGGEDKILDALHIYETEPETKIESRLMIIWSRDWLQCALVLDDECHALFDFQEQGGYNISEFPPPNNFWTRKGRTLTNDLITKIF